MAALPLVPLDDAVVFPGMPVTIPAISGNDRRVLLIPRRGVGYARVGVVAEVTKRHTIRGTAVMSLDALFRGVPGIAHGDQDGVLRVEVHEHPDVAPPQELTDDLEREYRAVVEEILELRGDDGRISAFVRSITEPGALADTAGYSPDLNNEQKLELLETLDIVQRLSLSLKFQRERLAELQVRKRIREDVENGAQKQQRDYFLRKQMDAIRKELGENEASVTEDYRKKIADAGMPEHVQQQAERELSRFERLGDQSAESSVIRTYLDWLLAVPWSKRSEDVIDPVKAREVLDADHSGLEDVKARITEYLAVRKLRKDRGLADDKRSGAILTLVGPPGTGKTSIGESIAKATGRKFVRMSLGGVRDESEIRGHRRTYIGALPGRLVRALRDAGTMNPVILLDEVDKLGHDWRGDPSSALLEVLDPAQNHNFQDHYLDVPLDLSHVMFIATANVADSIPGPLLDRMEVIRFDGYTTDEKVHIARGYLWPRQVERNGLLPEDVTIENDAAAAGRERLHARGRRPPARTRAGHGAAQDRDAGRDRRRAEADRDRRGGGEEGARPAEVRAGSRGADRGPRRGHGPGGDRHRRRRAVHRRRVDGRQGRLEPGADRTARRRDEGIGAHRADLRAQPRRPDRHRGRRLRRSRVPRARAGRRHPEGRPERGHHDGHGAGVAAHRPDGEEHRRHDR